MLTEHGTGMPVFDIAELDASWADGQARRRFWEAHYAEYLQRYPEQFVAVKDGEVIATHTDLYELVRVLESKGWPLPKPGCALSPPTRTICCIDLRVLRSEDAKKQ